MPGIASLTHDQANTGELTDYGYDIADKIELWLETNPGLHTPSTIARGIKADNTTHVWQVLTWMERHVYVSAAGNGRLRKYGAR